MIIDCISDLHGYYPTLEGGDLLIIAGDLTATNIIDEYLKFYLWLHKQEYKHYIFIAGNHDNLNNLIENVEVFTESLANTTYLCDSGTELEGLKIWGSPWTKSFEGMNPDCKAFTLDTEVKLSKKWDLIPDDTDILITHSPPNGILDAVRVKNDHDHVGSIGLRDRVLGRIKPKLHVFGHIHEWGGQTLNTNVTIFVNASHVNSVYEPVNKPVRIIL